MLNGVKQRDKVTQEIRGAMENTMEYLINNLK
jgi:hypothetical protein